MPKLARTIIPNNFGNCGRNYTVIGAMTQKIEKHK